MNYMNMSDEEIVASYHNGDYEAVDFLLERHKELVMQQTRALYLVGGDSQDLIQEGMIGLFKAVGKYDANKDASFKTYAKLCINSQLYNAIKASLREKNAPLNTSVSLDAPIAAGEADKEPSTLGETIPASTNKMPEEILIDQENVAFIEKELETALSSFENNVRLLYVSGLTCSEIANKLGKSSKSIDNALQRIRKKVLTIIQNNPI